MKKVKTIPAQEHAARRDPWYDALFDGELWELEASDWTSRFATVRSASSAVKQAAEHRGFTAQVAIRGDHLFVQANVNGAAKPVKRATAKTAKVTAAKAPAKKATRPRKTAAKQVAKAS